MMMKEFTDRTGYEPTWEEYAYIELSYYDFDGNKDEFCKQWKKDYKDGHWAREMALLKKMEQMEEENKKKIAEMEENLTFYRPYFQRAWNAEKALAEANNKLERIQRILNSVGVKEITD